MDHPQTTIRSCCKMILFDESKEPYFFHTMADNHQVGIIDEYIDYLKKKGYDMNQVSPANNGEGCSFMVWPASELESDGATAVKLRVVLGMINAEAQKYGEKYEVVEIVKGIVSLEKPSKPFDILSFNVREINTNNVRTVEAATGGDCESCDLMKFREWRFKSGPPEAPCTEKLPPPTTTTTPQDTTASLKKLAHILWGRYPYEDFGDDHDDDHHLLAGSTRDLSELNL